MKNGKLNGKVVVVTGASKGIGAGIAKEFAAEGASVVVNYSSAKQDADRVIDQISKRGGKAIACGRPSLGCDNSRATPPARKASACELIKFECNRQMTIRSSVD
jgi:NAD(P)-dependent dehydrogenase (short-subunit alcohol dehydrogenase family)